MGLRDDKDGLLWLTPVGASKGLEDVDTGWPSGGYRIDMVWESEIREETPIMRSGVLDYVLRSEKSNGGFWAVMVNPHSFTHAYMGRKDFSHLSNVGVGTGIHEVICIGIGE